MSPPPHPCQGPQSAAWPSPIPAQNTELRHLPRLTPVQHPAASLLPGPRGLPLVSGLVSLELIAKLGGAGFHPPFSMSLSQSLSTPTPAPQLVISNSSHHVNTIPVCPGCLLPPCYSLSNDSGNGGSGNHHGNCHCSSSLSTVLRARCRSKRLKVRTALGDSLTIIPFRDTEPGAQRGMVVCGRAKAKPRPAPLLNPAPSTFCRHLSQISPCLSKPSFFSGWNWWWFCPGALWRAGGRSKSEASGLLMATSAPEPAAPASKGRAVGLEIGRSLPWTLLPALPSRDTAFTVLCICPLAHLCY